MARQKKFGTPFQSLVRRISAIYLEGMRDLSPENDNRRTMKMHRNAGRQIVEEEQNGKDAAPYGTALLKELAKFSAQSWAAPSLTANLHLNGKFTSNMKFRTYVRNQPGATTRHCSKYDPKKSALA